MKRPHPQYNKQTDAGNYFKIVFLISSVLMLGALVMIMADESSKSVIEKPHIKINTASFEFASHDMIQLTNKAYAETDFIYTKDMEIKSYQTVLVIGKAIVSDDHKPAVLTLVGPNGETIYTPRISLDNSGEFKRLLHPPIGGFELGIHKITLWHPELESSMQTEFEVIEEVQLASEMSRKI